MDEYEEAMRDAPESMMPTDEELVQMFEDYQKEKEFEEKLSDFIECQIDGL